MPDNKKLKYVCHIVSWYPTDKGDKEAIWTKNHIEALQTHCDNIVYHVQVKKGAWKWSSKKMSDHEFSYVIYSPISIWFFKEVMTMLLLTYVYLFHIDRRRVDLYNFQITYPLLTYSKWITFLFRKPIVITEHWSAYHLNFGVKKELTRIKRIFKNKKLKFICVSEALAKDVINFSGVNIDYKIVPNIIFSEKFYFDKTISKSENTFFMLSYWKKPKRPEIVIEALQQIKNTGLKFHLRIGGDGPLLKEIKQKVSEYGFESSVVFLGKLNAEEIRREMNEATFFLHCSDYEVQSVVCLEALNCGCPVIASKVGGIQEYINEDNGILIENNEVEMWEKSLSEALKDNEKYNCQEISKKAAGRFSNEVVGLKYYETLSYFFKRKD